MRIYLISTLLAVCAMSSYAQNSVEPLDYLDQSHIEYAFEGGYDGYQEFIRASIEYPKYSYKDQIEGLLLFYFTVDTDKEKVEVTFLTKLDNRIEENVRLAFQSSFNKWKFAEPGKYTFYQPFVYSLLPYYADNLDGDLPEIPQALPLKFLQVFVLIKSKRIPEDFDINDATDDEISEKARSMYVRTQAAYEKSFENNNYEVAYALLTKLIRYNPLEKEYLFERIELEKKIEVNEYQVYDAMLLNDFMATYEKLDSYESVGASLQSAPELPYDSQYGMSDFMLAYETIYTYGYVGFASDLGYLFQFPNLSYINKEEGVALIEVKSDENGQVTANLLTNFDNAVQKGLANALKIMSLNWQNSEEPVHFIQPLYFSQSQNIAYEFAPTMPSFKIQSDSLFITPVEYSGMASAPMMDMVYDEPELSEDQKMENSTYRNYISAEKDFNKYLRMENTKKAVRALNDMIKLNPYDITLIKQRLEMGDKKTLSKYGAYDQKLIEALNSIK